MAAKDDSDGLDGEDEGEEKHWRDWPEAKAAAAQLEITQRQLLQFVRQNKLSRWRGDDGSWRYRPEDLEKLRDRLMGADEPTSSLESFGTMADVLAANVALLKQAHDHLEALMKLVTQPMAKGVEFVTQITQQQSEEIKALREAHTIAIATRERLLSEEEARSLLRKSEAAREQRKGEAWQLLIAQAPKLLTQLGESFVARNPEALAAAKLINSLDPQFVEAFAESDMLNDEQRALLRVVIARNAAKRAGEKAAQSGGAGPSSDGAKAPETPAEPSPSPPSPPAPSEAAAV